MKKSMTHSYTVKNSKITNILAIFLLGFIVQSICFSSECFKPIDIKYSLSESVLDVISDEDKFIVLDGNKILLKDGASWRSLKIDEKDQASRIIKAGNMYLVSGYHGAVYTSENLITWNKYTTEVSNDTGLKRSIAAMAWVNDQLVFLPHDYRHMGSKKMEGWGGSHYKDQQFMFFDYYDKKINVPLLFGPSIYNLVKIQNVPWSTDIFFQDEKYYLLSRRNGLYISNDLEKWTYLGGSRPEFEYNQAIASSSETFVTVGNFGFVEVSHDKGKTWKEVDVVKEKDIFKRPDFFDVIWDGKQFIAVGNCGAIIKSPDGDVWEYTLSNKADFYTSIAFNGKQYMIVGNSVGEIKSNAKREEYKSGSFKSVKNMSKTILVSEDAEKWEDISDSYIKAK